MSTFDFIIHKIYECLLYIYTLLLFFILCLALCLFANTRHVYNVFLQYCVVKFPALNENEKETVAVVPSIWINYERNICKWPPKKKYNSDKVTRWVMSLL